MESDRNYALEQGKAEDEHLRTQADIKSQQQRDAIAAADQAFTRSMDGINRAVAEAQLKGLLTNNRIAEYAATKSKAEATYAGALAKAGVGEAQARARIAQTQAQNAPAVAAQQLVQGAANIAATKANTAATNASTAESQRRLTTGVDDYHAPAAKGSNDDRYDAAFNALSPQGQDFLNTITNSPQPMTRLQAMTHIIAAHSGRKISDTDFHALQQIVTSKATSFYSDASEGSSARANANDKKRDAAANGRKNATDAAAVGRNPAIRKLSPNLQEDLRQNIEAYGYDRALQYLRSFAKTPGGALDQTSAQAILTALGA